MRLGLSLPVEMTGVAAAVRLAARAERLRYTDVFSSEAGHVDAFSPLAAVAVSTSTVRLGTALVPVFTRPPALVAMSAASVHALSSGRFVLGVGTSTVPIVERWMGLPFERPVERVREYVEALRRILAGESATIHGEEVRVERFRLQTGGAPEIPIHVGALGPRMCALAGAVADGVQFALMTPEGVRDALGHVRAGIVAAGRDGADLDVVLRVPIAVDEPRHILREVARRLLAGYAVVPTYEAALARQGYGETAAAVARAWRSGERGRAVSLVPDEVVDAFFVHGKADECRARLDQYARAGVRTAILMHVSAAPTPEERAERIGEQLEALV